MLELQRPLSFSVSGLVTSSGTTTVRGRELQFEGTGNATIKEVHTWKKIAGKPFEAAAPQNDVRMLRTNVDAGS